jgi:sugar phosphate isomerase/epimerase
MRLLHPDGQTVYLAEVVPAYPVNDIRALLHEIETYSGEVSCLSLALGTALASDLAGSVSMRRRLQNALANRGVETVTLRNAVNHRTWRTWWTYLLDLARVLADLLQEDTTHGSISTTVPAIGEDPWEAAFRELEDLSSGLTEIAWHTGAFIRVGCEIGDGTLLTTIDDAVQLLAKTDLSRIGVCLDPSPLHDAGDTVPQALVKLRRANLNVIKVHLDGEVSARQLLGSLLGGGHPVCDHYEVTSAKALKAAQEELAVLGMDGAGNRPMPGLGRSAA